MNLTRFANWIVATGIFISPMVWAETPQVLYVYGDVSAEGDVPSGDAKPFHQMRLGDEGPLGMSQFTAAIEAVGFSMEEAYDADLTLDRETLAPYRVLILASNQRRFSEDERSAVEEFVENGNGVIAWSDSAFGGHFRKVGLGNELGRLSDNDIMTAFGMYFMTDNGAGHYLVSEYEMDHYLNGFEKDGGVAFRGEGVSPVRVSEPAVMLAKLQEGGLGGGIRLNRVDGKLNPDTDAALAVAEVGDGRVVGVFDRNLFWNAGAGTRLSHSDNREFAQRIVIWAAGLEDEIAPNDSGSSGAKENRLPEVSVRAELASDGKSVMLIAEITDNDEDGKQPEVVWKTAGKNNEATFENNNPSGTEIRAFLPKAGKYQFLAFISDGEFSLRRSVTVTTDAGQ